MHLKFSPKYISQLIPQIPSRKSKFLEHSRTRKQHSREKPKLSIFLRDYINERALPHCKSFHKELLKKKFASAKESEIN